MAAPVAAAQHAPKVDRAVVCSCTYCTHSTKAAADDCWWLLSADVSQLSGRVCGAEKARQGAAATAAATAAAASPASSSTDLCVERQHAERGGSAACACAASVPCAWAARGACAEAGWQHTQRRRRAPHCGLRVCTDRRRQHRRRKDAWAVRLQPRRRAVRHSAAVVLQQREARTRTRTVHSARAAQAPAPAKACQAMNSNNAICPTIAHCLFHSSSSAISSGFVASACGSACAVVACVVDSGTGNGPNKATSRSRKCPCCCSGGSTVRAVASSELSSEERGCGTASRRANWCLSVTRTSPGFKRSAAQHGLSGAGNTKRLLSSTGNHGAVA